jgi:uncharacterized protein YqeY
MNLETLNKARINAMKNKDKLRKETISTLIDAVNKASIGPKGRIEITDELVDAAILKEKKTVQEMIDTCPASRAETLQEYKERLAIINEFAPQLITDAQEIENFIRSLEIELTKANRGVIMQALKGKVDMKEANKIVGGMLHD